MERATIGIIGGSGLYQLDGLTDIAEVVVETPYGPPSDAYVLGHAARGAARVSSRHGRGHRLIAHGDQLPGQHLGLQVARRRVAHLGLGGRQHEGGDPARRHRPPRPVHRPDEGTRPRTFFGDGIVAHVGFADPVCPDLAGAAAGRHQRGRGTASTAAGPTSAWRGRSSRPGPSRASTGRWGVDVIGMTNLPEAKLAREAEICYATLALVTDYDCWHESRGGRHHRDGRSRCCWPTSRRPRRSSDAAVPSFSGSGGAPAPTRWPTPSSPRPT